ncbi:MAG: sensor histidine kinase [Thermodesulfobacteriota bacterium]
MSKNQPISVLLVDDEEGVRRVLGIALTDQGYIVSTASNSTEAIQFFKQVHHQIVITDIKMPGKDGIALLREIKDEKPDTEVIMITGHGDLDLAVKSLKFEATDYITKPIHEDALEIALKRALERITIRRQLQDYTEKLEQLVEEKSKQLIEAERLAAIGQTVAGLSHAIKNIAGGLRGGAFLLEKAMEQAPNPYLLQGWRMVSGNVEKIVKLSMDLLNYAKTGNIHYEQCNPNQPVKEVVELVSPRAQSAGIMLRMELNDEIEPVDLDPEGIHQALLNLVNNALDACEALEAATEKKVTIRCRTVAGWAVEYQVEDNGVGMTPETRQQIFQYFFSTKGAKGNGIGLMMTKNIIDKHLGQISVTSEPGKGSLFAIRLPGPPRTPGCP